MGAGGGGRARGWYFYDDYDEVMAPFAECYITLAFGLKDTWVV